MRAMTIFHGALVVLLGTGNTLRAQGPAHPKQSWTARNRGPDTASNIRLAAPISSWEGGIPVGNGLLGGMLWGAQDTLRLSVDRGDLWDNRLPKEFFEPNWTWKTLQQLVQAGNADEIARRYEAPYASVYPTKLPATRIEFVLPQSAAPVRTFSLDLPTAEGEATGSGWRVRLLAVADRRVLLLHFQGVKPTLQFPPSLGLHTLGYQAAQQGARAIGAGTEQWMTQDAAQGLQYVVLARTQPTPDGTGVLVAITEATTADGPDPLSRARRTLQAALAVGEPTMVATHRRWWRQFWATSGVRVPVPAVQRLYDLAGYLYGSASRPGAAPIALEGVWSTDGEGPPSNVTHDGLPPWKGDYHYDLNAQLIYWPYLTMGHFEDGRVMLDWLVAQLPHARRIAHDFYGVPGAIIPGVETLSGDFTGGYPQNSFSPTNGAWLLDAFYRYWRYTGDRRFLQQEAYPMLSEVGTALAALLTPNAEGWLKLPLSNSPEIHADAPEAWMTPNSNYDLALLRNLFGELQIMADSLHRSQEATRWATLLQHLEPLAVEGDSGALRLSSTESLASSEPVESHLVAIHPLGVLTIDQGPRARAIIRASFEQLEHLGSGGWYGYTFAMVSCLEARAGRATQALQYLDDFINGGFLYRNGLHRNGGDGTVPANTGWTAFTLEGNFGVAQVVNEMLLQSWGGTVRVFPAVAPAWSTVGFTDLRAEGGWRVSAERTGGRTVRVEVIAARGGRLRLQLPVGETLVWNRPVRADSSVLTVSLRPGEPLIGTAETH